MTQSKVLVGQSADTYVHGKAHFFLIHVLWPSLYTFTDCTCNYRKQLVGRIRIGHSAQVSLVGELIEMSALKQEVVG